MKKVSFGCHMLSLITQGENVNESALVVVLVFFSLLANVSYIQKF